MKKLIKKMNRNEEGKHMEQKIHNIVQSRIMTSFIFGILIFELVIIPLYMVLTVLDVIRTLEEKYETVITFTESSPKYKALLENGETVNARNCSSKEGITTCDVKVYPEIYASISEGYVVSSYESISEEDLSK